MKSIYIDSSSQRVKFIYRLGKKKYMYMHYESKKMVKLLYSITVKYYQVEGLTLPPRPSAMQVQRQGLIS